MKLHLGCGKKKLDGYVNIDITDSDLNCDIRKLPFDDNSADEIMAIHVCEHFYIHEIKNVLAEWRRVLKPGGKLIAELPCWNKVIEHIKRGSDDYMTRNALYGHPKTHKDDVSIHKWCWSANEFATVLRMAGYSDYQMLVPEFHQPTRDMRFEAIK